MDKRPNIINSEKASRHALRPGRFYKANVTAVDAQGQVSVTVPDIGSSFGPITPLGTTTLNKLSVGDLVQCTFSDEYFTDVIVFGNGQIKPDIYASKILVDSMVTQIASLVSLIAALDVRVTALENP